MSFNNLFKLDVPQIDRWPNPRAIVVVDIHEQKLRIVKFMRDSLYNLGVMECYEDVHFYNDLEFDILPGMYMAELDIEDTTVDYGPDGIEYDCEPNIIFKQRFDFDTMEWVDYDQSQKNDSTC